MGLVGNLRDLNITNIIELNCIEKSTAQVTIKTRSGDAMVFFNDGEIVHARWGDFKGTEALYRILRLNDGGFRVTSDITPPERTIFDSWKGLIFEGMRVYDENKLAKDRIAQTLADELKGLSGVSYLLIFADNGAVVHQQGALEAARVHAISAFLNAQGARLSDTLHLGPLDYATYVHGDQMAFVFHCDQFLVALAVPRTADIGPVRALVQRIRDRLKSSDNKGEAEHQSGKAARV